jgi:hypothetical protein
MNKLISLIILVLISNLAFTQNGTTIKWGKAQKINNKTTIRFIGKDNSSFFTLKFDKRLSKRWIEKYDHELNLVFSKELKVPKGEFKDVVYLDNQLTLFSTYMNNKEKKSSVYAYKIDNKGAINSEYDVVSNVDLSGKKPKQYMKARLYRNQNKIGISHGVYYHRSRKSFKNEIEKKIEFETKVYDDKLNFLWPVKFMMAYYENDMVVKGTVVDDENNFYIEVISIRKPTRYFIVYYNQKSKEVKHYKIEIPDKRVNNMTYKLDSEKGTLLVTGFYSDYSNPKFEGVYQYIINPRKEDVKIKLNPLKKIGSFPYEATQDSLRIIHMYSTSEYFYLVSEKYYETYKNYTGQDGNQYKDYDYHFEDISIIKISLAGEIIWAKLIKKKTWSESTFGAKFLYSSVDYDMKSDNLKFIINLPPEYLNLKENVKTNVKIWKPIVVFIDKDGAIERSSLTSDIELKNKALDKFQVIPKKRMKLSNNEHIIFGTKGSQYKFGKIKYNRD